MLRAQQSFLLAVANRLLMHVTRGTTFPEPDIIIWYSARVRARQTCSSRRMNQPNRNNITRKTEHRQQSPLFSRAKHNQSLAKRPKRQQLPSRQ
jgi:hypothetical protein